MGTVADLPTPAGYLLGRCLFLWLGYALGGGGGGAAMPFNLNQAWVTQDHTPRGGTVTPSDPTRGAVVTGGTEGAKVQSAPSCGCGMGSGHGVRVLRLIGAQVRVRLLEVLHGEVPHDPNGLLH